MIKHVKASPTVILSSTSTARSPLRKTKNLSTPHLPPQHKLSRQHDQQSQHSMGRIASMSTQASSASFNYNESMMRLQKQSDLSALEKSRAAAFPHKASHSITTKAPVVSLNGQVVPQHAKKKGGNIPRAKNKSLSQLPNGLAQGKRLFSPQK